MENQDSMNKSGSTPQEEINRVDHNKEVISKKEISKEQILLISLNVMKIIKTKKQILLKEISLLKLMQTLMHLKKLRKPINRKCPVMLKVATLIKQVLTEVPETLLSNPFVNTKAGSHLRMISCFS